MAIHFDYSLKGDLLLITTSGKDDNLKEVENYIRSIGALAFQNNCDKVLCDERDLSYSISFLDTYDLAENVSQKAKFIKKVAVVCDQKYLKDGKFYELVSNNRGLNMLVTDNIQQAKKWIQ